MKESKGLNKQRGLLLPPLTETLFPVAIRTPHLIAELQDREVGNLTATLLPVDEEKGTIASLCAANASDAQSPIT